MSLINNVQDNQSSASKMFGDYKIEESSSLNSLQQTPVGKKAYLTQSGVSYGNDEPYNINLDLLRKESNNTISILNSFLNDLENLLRQVNLDPTNNPNIEEAHNYIWDEINKKNIDYPKIEVDGYPGDLKYPKPPFICFDQYLYAEDCTTRAHRKFVKEYDNLISNSSFGHIYDYREIIKYLLNETECIKTSLNTDFGDTYEDESQQQVATYYLYWFKMAIHYKELFAQSITASTASIPESEVDKTTKKQAAQFQAFFSIRVNSLTVSIDNQLDSLHKDLVTNCGVFYKNFLSPSLRFKTKVISDFSLELKTTQMKSEMPTLSEELAIALLTMEGNFKSVLTDLLERRNHTTLKIDLLLQSITQRRKYISNIIQLSAKALSKEKIVTKNTNENYATLLAGIYVNTSASESLKSSHGLLDDLGEDSHPQYLMKSGGSIIGDIITENDAKIDGLKVKTHSHSGTDGSARVRSIDIDYDSVRRDISLNEVASLTNEIVINIDSYTPDILQGGVPVADVNISIEIPDEYKDKYDFEILYIEL